MRERKGKDGRTLTCALCGEDGSYLVYHVLRTSLTAEMVDRWDARKLEAVARIIEAVTRAPVDLDRVARAADDGEDYARNQRWRLDS